MSILRESGKIEIEIKDHRGNIEVRFFGGEYFVWLEIIDINGPFWEFATKCPTIKDAMIVVSNTLKLNIENDFYE